jgi:hypothetical protein
LREKFNDGHGLGNEWEYSRLINFVQRPNIHTRAKLRESINHLINMKHEDYYRLNMTNNVYVSVSSGKQVRMNPCITLHVRHGDSVNDQRNNSGGVNI